MKCVECGTELNGMSICPTCGMSVSNMIFTQDSGINGNTIHVEEPKVNLSGSEKPENVEIQFINVNRPRVDEIKPKVNDVPNSKTSGVYNSSSINNQINSNIPNNNSSNFNTSNSNYSGSYNTGAVNGTYGQSYAGYTAPNNNASSYNPAHQDSSLIIKMGEPKKKNSVLGVVSLILTCTCVFSFIGLICAIVDLLIKDDNKKTLSKISLGIIIVTFILGLGASAYNYFFVDAPNNVAFEDSLNVDRSIPEEPVISEDSVDESVSSDDAVAEESSNEDGAPIAEESNKNDVSENDIATEELAGSAFKLDINSIPEYKDVPYVEVNDNLPCFNEADKASDAFEKYSELDDLGRCGVAFANIDKSIMPAEERGEIGNIQPTGWETIKYDFIDGNYLYNRCHLIAYELAGENDNEKNLITGTRFMNIQGMLPFEDEVAGYVEETGNHVLYRVTPIFVDDELLARGVEMEGYSVEDEGKGISFHVFAYNIEPNVDIDYATGKSELSKEYQDSLAKAQEEEKRKAEEVELANQKAEIENQKAEFEKQKTEFEEEKKELAKQQEELQKEKTELEKQKGDIEKQKSDLEKQKSDLEKQKSDLEKQKQDFENKKSSYASSSGTVSDTTKSSSSTTNSYSASTENYVGNKNTKKFHYPWCSSVNKMKEGNKVYFNGVTRDSVINKGYKPCQNCNP